MKRWTKRLLYTALLLFWLGLVLLPGFAFVLAAREEIRIGSSPLRHVRVFLISGDDAAGIGVERARPVRDPAGCAETTVSFLLWRGESDRVAYCQCFDEQENLVSSDRLSCSALEP